MSKIYFVFQFVFSIALSAFFLFDLVRISVEKQDAFLTCVFAVMLFLGIALVKISWRELRKGGTE